MGAACSSSGRLCGSRGALFGGAGGGPPPHTLASLFAASAYDSGRGDPQVGILGTARSGKTTLFYSVVLRRPLDPAEVADLPPTRGVVYEIAEREANGALHRFGVWEVDGSPAMRELWPFLTHYVQFDALVLVFKPDDKLRACAEAVVELAASPDLETAALAVVVNAFGGGSRAEEAAEAFRQRLAADVEMLLGKTVAQKIAYFAFDARQPEGPHWPQFNNALVARAVAARAARRKRAAAAAAAARRGPLAPDPGEPRDARER